MNLIDSNDILKASKLDRFGGNLGGSLVAKLVMYIKSTSCIPMYIAIIPKLFWTD